MTATESIFGTEATMYSNGSNTQFQDKHNDFDVGLYFFTIKYHKSKSKPTLYLICMLFWARNNTGLCICTILLSQHSKHFRTLSFGSLFMSSQWLWEPSFQSWHKFLKYFQVLCTFKVRCTYKVAYFSAILIPLCSFRNWASQEPLDHLLVLFQSSIQWLLEEMFRFCTSSTNLFGLCPKQHTDGRHWIYMSRGGLCVHIELIFPLIYLGGRPREYLE